MARLLIAAKAFELEEQETYMTDDRRQTDAQSDMPIDADATDVSIEQIIPPEQPPMDDAAGGPTVDVENDQSDEVSADDLSVQGGE